MATMSVNATAERPGTLRGRLSVVPWVTVVPLAVVLAYADGFWVISLRGAAGSIERTGEPFVTWLRESTLVLPFFILAVLGALALAARWFEPALHKSKPVVATGAAGRGGRHLGRHRSTCGQLGLRLPPAVK